MSKFLSRLGSFLSNLVGSFSVKWTPPPWPRPAWKWLSARPKFSISLAALALILGSVWIWLAAQPDKVPPNLVTIKVSEPGIAAVRRIDGENRLVPASLRLQFSEASAPLALLAEPSKGVVTEGIRLKPELAGAWKWLNDKVLIFTPSDDWLPDRTYEVVMQPKRLLVDTVALQEPVLEFATAKFTAQVVRGEFYQNPKNPEIKQAVVTYKFSHGVKEVDLRKHLDIAILGDAPLFAGDERLEEIRLGDFDRLAYVRTKPIELPGKEDFVQVTLKSGMPVALGDSRTEKAIPGKVKIPDLYSYFQIKDVFVGTRRKDSGEPEPHLRIRTQGLTSPEDFLKHLKVYLLPKWQKPENPDPLMPEETGWTVDSVSQEILATSTEVKLTPDAREDADKPVDQRRTHFDRYDFTFDRLPEERQLLCVVDKDTPALGGYRLAEEYRATRNVPQGPRELYVLGRFGGLLAMTGDRKITVKSRNLPGLKYRLGRVPAGEINHLVSQTSGNFNRPGFSRNFNDTNLGHYTEQLQSILSSDSYAANYSTLDFSRLLDLEDQDDPDLNRGLYFLRVLGWDPKEEKAVKGGGQEGDNAFVLITDLGLVVKVNHDRTRDVFVQSLGLGVPVDAVEVQVLGKNGVPLVSGVTDSTGRATLAAVDEAARDESQPVAIVARKDRDLSFIPFNRYQQHVSFSRFDVGGLSAPTAGDLDGFVFTERGVYRPGDTIHAGLIIKPRDWSGELAGLPIKVVVQDARNSTILEQLVSLPQSGFADFECPTEYASSTGEYKLYAYLVHEEDEDGKKQRDTLLASTSARVEEFLPDTMKVSTKVTPESGKGWIPPAGLSASVNAQNLYGTPATKRSVSGSVTARPIRFSFDDFPDYVFFDRNLKAAKYHTWATKKSQTDDNGAVTIPIDMSAIGTATYSVSFQAEVFEPDSGRSVKAYSNRLLVSPLPHAVGYKPDGELRYIPANGIRKVQLVAVNPQLEKIDLQDLNYSVEETYYVSILKEQGSGDFAYQSVKKEREVASGTLSIGQSDGFELALPTEAPGEFSLLVSDAEGNLLSKMGYSVVGKGNRSRSLDDNAELFVKLAKPEYRRGEEIELSITAPFTGTGLLTIERDRVYAHKYFTTTTNSSVQTIAVPDELEGTGYVNVTFVRSLDSPEIFMSPLSYAVTPFRVVNDSREIKLTLDPAEKARPGKPLRIPYQADRNCKIAIFAVDEGILQVTRYETPKPLPHFERKRALLCQTYQILDLLIPEHRHIQEQLSAFGGGADFQLNPFKRLTDAPVVFWSGILDAGPEVREVTYDVPDYFNGSLRVMAIAASRDGMGHAESRTTLVSPVLINPGVPTFAAPGDEFDVSVTLGNNLDPETGEEAEIRLTVTPSKHLEVITPPPAGMTIPREREETLTFRVRATGELGSASLKFAASGGNETSTRTSTLSIRPATPYTTIVQSGYTGKSTLDVSLGRDLHEEFHQAEASASVLPLSLTRGLDQYLAKYPHGCTEQLVSGSLARLLIADEADFGLTKAEVQKQVDATCRMLRNRMNSSGGFGYWYSAKTPAIDFLSIYATHYLSEAQIAGFEVPPALHSRALGNLRKMAAVTKLEKQDCRDQAYAIYVLTRNGVVTTNYILNLRDYLRKNAEEEAWQKDLTAVYLAGSYQLLKQRTEAARLIRGYQRASQRPPAKDDAPEDDFHPALAQDAQYLAILTRHFPEEAKKLSGDDLRTLLDPLLRNEFSTLSAAYSVLALKGYSELADQFPIQLELAQVVDDSTLALPTEGTKLVRAGVPLSADAVKFSAAPSRGGPSGIFYQVTEGGFERTVPTEPLREGIEVERLYLDKDGNPLAEATLGEPITVQLQLRSLKQGQTITNVALTDLLPGGFEVVRESLSAGRSTLPGMAFNEVREDRVVLFGVAQPQVQLLRYKITPTRRGEFIVPPVLADSMYDRSVRARGLPGRIVVK